MKYDKALVATGGSPRKLFVPGSDTLAMQRWLSCWDFFRVRVEFFFFFRRDESERTKFEMTRLSFHNLGGSLA